MKDPNPEIIKWSKIFDLSGYTTNNGDAVELQDSGTLADITDALMDFYGSKVKITIRRLKS